MKLKPPSAEYTLSILTSIGKAKASKGTAAASSLEPGIDFVVNDTFVAGQPDVFAFPSVAKAFPLSPPDTYNVFRNTWLLKMRKRPVVPCPEVCPMPSRKKSKEMRSKTFSVYLRPWTLLHTQATVEVPFLSHLRFTKEQLQQLQDDQDYEALEDDTTNIRTAWKQYTAKVLPHAFRQVRNFMLASIAEGRSFEQEEDGLKRGDALRCDLNIADIEKALAFQKLPDSNAANNDDKNTKAAKQSQTAVRVWESTSLAVKLATLTQVHVKSSIPKESNLTKFCFSVTATPSDDPSLKLQESPSTSDLKTKNWTELYVLWHAEVYQNKESRTPNAQQAEILKLIHQRRLVEYAEENGEDCSKALNCRQPLLRLIHGLPGSGKTEVLRWIQSYFEQVWLWTLGKEFAFLAPLNSMASNIQGSTVHSWGKISFKDRRGVIISTQQGDSEEIPSLTIQCNATRFLFIDEIEATGADTVGSLEYNIMRHISPKNIWRYREDGKSRRIFGGLNVCMFGDFWQLSPTGQIAIMGDPTASKVLESARSAYIMNIFWNSQCLDTLDTWHDEERVLQLTTNIRSGEDTWFAHFLESCRAGALTEDDYNFFHGYPTSERICFWYTQRDTEWQHPKWCKLRGNGTPFILLSNATEAPRDEKAQPLECLDCFKERQRRARVLHIEASPSDAADKINAPDFADSVYITPFNKAVFFYGTRRARKFAEENKHQLFWVQATDTPPAWFASGYSKAELTELKTKRLQFHSRKTEGILSLLPSCYNMPFKVTHSHGHQFKEYGIHNGAYCILKSWILDETDERLLGENQNSEVVLQCLPKKFYVEMISPMKKQYPGLLMFVLSP